MIGSTDELGLRAVGDPRPPERSHASILGLLGLDHTKLTYPYLGRNFRLTDVGGKTDLVEKLRKGLIRMNRAATLFLVIALRRICRRSRRPGPRGRQRLDAGRRQTGCRRRSNASWPTTFNMPTPAAKQQTKRAVHRCRDQRTCALRVVHLQRSEDQSLRQGRGADRLLSTSRWLGRIRFRVRTLQVYTENNGQWQMSAHQSTRLGR